MKIVISDYPDSMMPTHELECAILKKGLGDDTEIVIHPYQDNEREAFYEVIHDADAILTAFTRIDAEAMDHAPKLKVISMNATGYDNVDLTAANKRRIGVCPVGEYCTQDVAEFTIAVMMALVKNIKYYTHDIEQAHQWRYDYPDANPRLYELTLGIFGLGKIGRAVARRAQALGMTVVAYDPFTPNPPEPGVRMVSVQELCGMADIIANHMSLNETNYDFFNRQLFEQMAQKPYFINMGRGASVVEQDLIAALDAGQLKGAAVDVLRDETPDLANHPLVGRQNVYVTPHAAFYTTTSLAELQRISTENIVHYLTGRKDKVFRLVSDS